MFQKDEVEPLVLRQRGAPGEPGPRALLVHGLGSSDSCWDDFVAHRPPGLDLWSAGMPWRAGGPFAVPERDETAWISEAVARIPGGVDLLIAHSYGALLTLTLLAEAATDPARRAALGIRGAVLVAPFYRQHVEDFSWEELPGSLDLLRQGAQHTIRIRSRRAPDPDLEFDMAERSCHNLGPHWVVRYLHTYQRTPFLPVDLIDLPVRVVVGACDSIASPAEGETLAARLGNASIDRIDGSGHTPMAERPERFSRVVQQFLTTLPAGRPPAAVN